MSPTNASLPRLISFVSFVADATIGSHSIETSAILTGTWHARTFIDVCKKKKSNNSHFQVSCNFLNSTVPWRSCYNKTELYTSCVLKQKWLTLSFRGKSWSHRAKQIKSSWNTKRQVSNQAGKWRLLWWKLIIYSVKILISQPKFGPWLSSSMHSYLTVWSVKSCAQIDDHLACK